MRNEATSIFVLQKKIGASDPFIVNVVSNNLHILYYYKIIILLT